MAPSRSMSRRVGRHPGQRSWHPWERGKSNTGKIAISKRLITVKDVTLCRSSCSLTLTYSDVSVPCDYRYSDVFDRGGQAGNEPLEPLTPAPTILVNQSGCDSVCPGHHARTTQSYGDTGDLPQRWDGGQPHRDGVSTRMSLGLTSQCNNTPNQPTVAPPRRHSQRGRPCVVLWPDAFTLRRRPTPDGTLCTRHGRPSLGPPARRAAKRAISPRRARPRQSGQQPRTDAADYPCPPTAAQRAAGVSCNLSFSDEGGKQQTVDISLLLSPPPSTTTADASKRGQPRLSTRTTTSKQPFDSRSPASGSGSRRRLADGFFGLSRRPSATSQLTGELLGRQHLQELLLRRFLPRRCCDHRSPPAQRPGAA